MTSNPMLWCQRCKKFTDDLHHVTIKPEHRWPGGAREFYLCFDCLKVLESLCATCAGLVAA